MLNFYTAEECEGRKKRGSSFEEPGQQMSTFMFELSTNN